jgi:hypothetical protein
VEYLDLVGGAVDVLYVGLAWYVVLILELTFELYFSTLSSILTW